MMKYHERKKRERIERAKAFSKLWKTGMTLKDIGLAQTPPISRERVRQLIGTLDRK